MGSGRAWTAADDALLDSLLAQNVQPKLIAPQLGRTPKAVTQRMHVCGLKVPLELVRQRRADGCRKKVASPEGWRQHSATQRRNWTPERRQAASQRMKANNEIARLHTPEVKARSKEVLRRKKIERQWAIIEAARKEFLAAIERERLAAMTPFERQLERVRAGAQIMVRPNLSPANDREYSLTGCGLAL